MDRVCGACYFSKNTLYILPSISPLSSDKESDKISKISLIIIRLRIDRRFVSFLKFSLAVYANICHIRVPETDNPDDPRRNYYALEIQVLPGFDARLEGGLPNLPVADRKPL